MAGLTLTQLGAPHSTGDRWEVCWKVVGGTSYPTNGEPLAWTSLGFASTAASDTEAYIEVDNLCGYGAQYDYVNQKLKIYASANTEVSNATDLSTNLANIRLRACSKYRA